MHEPFGTGFWIAFPRMIARGDPQAIVETLLRVGASWVAPRGCEGATRDIAWTARHTQLCNDHGIRVYRWAFSRPQTYRQECAFAREWRTEGDSGFIIDAEAAWAHRDAEAVAYGAELRTMLGKDYFVADSPWPYISLHPEYPWLPFAQFVNARMPQAYWTEISADGAGVHLPRIDAEWEAFAAHHPRHARPVYPVGVTYGRREIARWNTKTLPPGELAITDVVQFLARYGARQTCSLYSLEAASKPLIELLASESDRSSTLKDSTLRDSSVFLSQHAGGGNTPFWWEEAHWSRRGDSELFARRHDALKKGA